MAYSKTTWANNTTPAINADNLNKIEDGIFTLDKSLGLVANEGNIIIPSASNYYLEFKIEAGKTYNITDTGSSGQLTMVTRATKSGANLDNIGTFRAGETKQFIAAQNANWLVGYANSATSIFVEEAGLEIPSLKNRVSTAETNISSNTSNITSLNNNVQYSLDETQNYADNGLTRLNGFFRRGNIYNGAINLSIKYRALSLLQVYDRKITLNPVDPTNFKFFYVLSDSEGSVGNASPWYTTPVTLNENTYFYLVVGRVTENVSEVIDPNEFASKVVIESKIYSEIKSAFGNSEVSRLNKPVEQMVYNLAKGRATVFGDDFTPLEFIHFSDVHQASDLWKRICDYMDEYHNQIPFALHTGDYVKASELQYTDLYAVQSPENGYILNCVGNHDTYADNAGTTTEPASTVYSRLFNHISDWGVTFGTATNAMYYYKDFEDEGIRLIVIDQYYWDDAENTWFRNLLDDAITNDLAVITAGHVITAPLPMNKRVDCTFTTKDAWVQGGSELVLIQNLGFDDILKDFVDAGGEFICHLSGHYHHDIMGYTENDILNVVIECATNDHAGWCDSERIVGTKGYDCFNIISIDRSLHTIRLVRVGNSFDFYGREKNVLCYDYLNKQVIANF